METLTMQEYMHELYTDGVIEDYDLTGLGASTAEVTRFDGRTLVIDFGYETIHDSLTEKPSYVLWSEFPAGDSRHKSDRLTQDGCILSEFEKFLIDWTLGYE